MNGSIYLFIGGMTRSAVTLGLSLIFFGGMAAPAAAFSIATGGAAQSASFDGNNYLIGIESHLTSPPTIGAQMMSAAGAKVGSLIPTGRSGIATNVAFDGTNYLLIWEDDGLNALNNGSQGFQVYGQFISTAGAVVGTPFNISGLGIWFDGVKTMAFGGGKYLVTYTRLINPALGGSSPTNRYIAGRIVSPDGSIGSEFRISTGYGNSSDVAFDGTNFFVVWSEDSADQQIRGRFVSPAGVLGTEISVNASVAPSDNPKSVAFDGTNYLVVWNDEVGGTNAWDVFGQRVDTSGVLVGGVITITAEPGPQMVTTVAFDGSSYLAVWIDMQNGTNWDMYGQFISTSGVLMGSKITLNTDAGNQMGGVGFANGAYLVLVNSGVIMGQGGFSQIAASYGMFVAPPAGITGIVPTTGLVGTTVTISGNGFDPGASVSFNGVPAVVTGNTGTQLTVSVPAGATTGPVSVSNAGMTINGPIFTPQYTLSENVIGNGQINGTFACLTGTCANTYVYNTPIALSASERYGSMFTAWSGSCLGADKNNCSFDLTGDKSVTASFAKLNTVQVTTGIVTAYYDTLANAFGAGSIIAAGSTVKTLRTDLFDFNGETLVHANLTVWLSGGYDAGFANSTGYSTIKGPLRITSGKLTIANIKVRP